MSNINPIIYHDVFKINGLNYNIKVFTADAKVKSDPTKVKELVESILCSHFGVDKIEDLHSRQITETKIEYNPKEGSKIDGNPSDKKIREVFSKTFSSNNNYKGMKVAGEESTISDAIEDLYNLQTSGSISGSVGDDNSWTSWFIDNAFSYGSSLLKYLYFNPFEAKNLDDDLKDRQNLNHIKELCDAANDGTEASAQAKNFFKKNILKHIQDELTKAGKPHSIDQVISKFKDIIEMANARSDENIVINSNFDRNIKTMIKNWIE